eukprot:2979396-Lingulodinium_polyedra.AAC.1
MALMRKQSMGQPGVGCAPTILRLFSGGAKVRERCSKGAPRTSSGGVKIVREKFGDKFEEKFEEQFEAKFEE